MSLTQRGSGSAIPTSEELAALQAIAARANRSRSAKCYDLLLNLLAVAVPADATTVRRYRPQIPSADRERCR